jgi:tetratricopeptide (TPR) repeat protein
MAVAGEYRCPVCAGESVAASEAPEAVEIRGLVQRWLGEGRSQAQIRAYLVKDYGTSILEKPPASGVSLLVWALPVVAVAAGLIALGLGFARWRRAALALALPAAGGLEGVAVPHQQARFELGPEGATNGSPSTAAAQPVPGLSWRVPRRLPRRASLVAGTALVLLAATLWLVDRSVAPRLPGGTVTGGSNGTSAELQQASALAATDPAAALAILDEVLASQPDQPEALTDEGWIYAQGGFVVEAMARLTKAEKVGPAYDAAHLYRALVLLDDEDRPGPAAAELEWYLAHGPAPALVAVARTALVEAKAKGNKPEA